GGRGIVPPADAAPHQPDERPDLYRAPASADLRSGLPPALERVAAGIAGDPDAGHGGSGFLGWRYRGWNVLPGALALVQRAGVRRPDRRYRSGLRTGDLSRSPGPGAP